MLKSYIYKYNFLRYIEIILGLIFITSAVLKVIEINRFCVQIYAYGVITNKELLPFIAVVTILIEITIGVLFLLAFPYRKLSMGANLALLFIFTCLILYGWIFNDLKDCGCFGRIEVGPGTSVLKNLMFIFFTILCFTGVKHGEIVKDKKYSLRFVIPLLIIWGLTLSVSINKLNQEKIKTQNNKSDSLSPYAGMVLEIENKTYNLGEGDYLIALVSFGCDHCLEEAPKLNQYVLYGNLPPLIALCLEESQEEKEEFITKIQPIFPIYSLGDKVRLFFSLIGKEPPRLVYLNNGKIVKYWDYDLPNPEVLEEEIRKAEDKKSASFN
ncbi:MAG TPA: hypothetical protein PLT82_04195 [Candidatus Hydrogenedens sp.]|nr:hypothetical protein [Candidatus Hydrogenedens sp.]HOL20976.1 hypothetical protein [Candidatus Hydrogenedens sp.]HPP58312.1 hypothetical protein [Candidatus Hydrogenedens sp.]